MINLTKILFVAALLGGTFTFANAQTPPIILGITQNEADQYNTEFLQGNRMVPMWDANHIQASLVEYSELIFSDATENQIYKLLKQYHVIHLICDSQGVEGVMKPEHFARAKVVGAALAHYVQDGGGLFLQPQAVRYLGDEDEKYWNLVFQPLGVAYMHEGVFDPTRTYMGYARDPSQPVTFWWTQNIAPHPVTEGVKSLYLPLDGMGDMPGLEAMKYSPDWQIVVRGEKEAKSYGCKGDDIDPKTPGTYDSAPPVVAVRTLGKGRIVCYPTPVLYTGRNYDNPIWPNIVETVGDPTANRPSDSLKLQMNAYKWLAQPAQADPLFGTYKQPEYKPIEFPKSVVHEPGFPAPVVGIKGIFGAHTSYSDGTGTVADYVAAAKAAGLSIIVFNDPLEKMTKEKLDKLKADCKAATDSTFFACPGIEFTDGNGIRWAYWDDNVVFPDTSFKEGSLTYQQWDGSRVLNYGKFAEACGFPGSAVIDYKQFPANGVHPDNLWWFYDYIPLAFDGGKLIADNYNDFLYGLHDLRWASIASFTRIHSPSEVANAAKTCFTGFNDLSRARGVLNAHLATYDQSVGAKEYVSQGPLINVWATTNLELGDDWLYTRGAQRSVLRFEVHSDNGIAEVRVHDANLSVVRRFLGNGAKDFARQFEVVHDKSHWFALEVIDTKGLRAFGQVQMHFSRKQALYRCGDNCNALGYNALLWYPDRQNMLPADRLFGNGDDFSLYGYDSSGPVCPQPLMTGEEEITIQGVGQYPDFSKGTMLSKQLDVNMSSYQVQIITHQMTKIAPTFLTAQRPAPADASPPRDIGDNEYFTRTDTIICPADRLDNYIVGDHRRRREGRKDYRGGLLWHEGEIRFKKDCTLQGAVPIPLIDITCPLNVKRGWGTSVVITDTKSKTVPMIQTIQSDSQNVILQGDILPGGYASWMTAPIGFEAILTPKGSDMTYDVEIGPGAKPHPHTWCPGYFIVGIGHDGQQVKAGDVMKYEYAEVTFPAPKGDIPLIESTAKTLNMGGGHDGYPIEMKTGEIVDSPFFFTARAKDNEAAFKLGPGTLPCDLPMRIQGIEDNGCAAVFSTVRQWFRFVGVTGNTAYLQEPIDSPNDMWVGNVFVCDDKAVKLTLVVDSQAPGKLPFLEVHNPTDKPITTRVWSPANTPSFGGMTTTVDLPAGNSITLTIDQKQFKKQPQVTQN